MVTGLLCYCLATSSLIDVELWLSVHIGLSKRLQSSSEHFSFNVLISGGKSRFQHMSVIYISLLSGCPCSRAVSKPDEYILGINRVEELKAKYPARPFSGSLISNA